jgi:hypothetical protein
LADESTRGVSAIRGTHPQTSNVLGQILEGVWHPGFLDDVAKTARKNYFRAQWADHWIKLFCRTEEPTDFWRFGKLAEGIVDWRFVGSFESFGSGGALLDVFGKELYSRLEKAAKDRRDKRENTLYGTTATVAATESAAQMVVNHFKNYLRQTNTLYAQDVKTQIETGERQRRQQLQEAIAREEKEREIRQRIKSNLTW